MTKKPSTVGEKGPLQLRIEEVAAEHGWTQADFVRHSGASRSMVGQWFGQVAEGKEPIQTIRDVEVAVTLSGNSGYSAVWLAKGVGPKKLTSGRDRQSEELMRIHGLLDEVGKARLLAFAADLARGSASTSLPAENRRANGK